MVELFHIRDIDPATLGSERERAFRLLRSAVSFADVIEVGSSAVEGVIGKQDIDFLVRVPGDRFAEARGILDRRFERDALQLANDEFQGYRIASPIDVSAQLTIAGGRYDMFEPFLIRLRSDPAVRDAYNELKRNWNGRAMDAYRAAKGEFIASVLASGDAGCGMVKPWRLIASRIALADPWITVRADTCQREDGVVIDPFYVLERQDWVCILPVTEDGDVVLTVEYRHGIASVVAGLPGGVVESEDASPEAAAARELLEETGYACERLVALGSLYANWANQTNRFHYFLGIKARAVADPRFDAAEQIEVLRKPWSEVRSSQLLRQSYHVACVHLAEPHLSAR
jgi:8-oxo-dGTP pyrophosphatase MutT (NUDIX family)/GrpB-like predicted nucleotidyltransferase (UPF0157 family)